MSTRNFDSRGRLLAVQSFLLTLVSLLVAGAAFFSGSTASAAPVKATVPAYAVVEAGLPGHTVYRPVDLKANTPVLVWGEGGCAAVDSLYSGFLTAIAARGVVVISNTEPGGLALTNQAQMNASVDWAVTENARVGGPYFGRLSASHTAVAGWSCGGLEAYTLALSRPEVAALGILNSGQLLVDQSQLDRLAVPVLYLLGGPWDVAYQNGLRDFAHLPVGLPAFLGTSDRGHFGTYFEPDGGEYAQILADWVLYRVTGDVDAASTFVGTDCRLCTNSAWSIQQRNIA